MNSKQLEGLRLRVSQISQQRVDCEPHPGYPWIVSYGGLYQQYGGFPSHRGTPKSSILMGISIIL